MRATPDDDFQQDRCQIAALSGQRTDKAAPVVGVSGLVDGAMPFWNNMATRSRAIDLPGSPGNKQPLAQVTMDAYVKTVVDAINALDHKVVLVGHSLTGAVISQVGELML